MGALGICLVLVHNITSLFALRNLSFNFNFQSWCLTSCYCFIFVQNSWIIGTLQIYYFAIHLQSVIICLKSALFHLFDLAYHFFLVVWPLFEPLTFDPISGQKPPDCHSLGQGQPMAVIAPGQHEFDGHRSLPRGNRPMRSFTSPNPHNQSNLFSGVHHHSTPKHQIGKVGQDIMVKSRLFSSESFAKESHLVLFLD